MDSAELLKTIEDHPLTQQILAEKQVEILKKRTAAASRIGDLKGELESLPTPYTVTEPEEQELREIEARAQKLRAEITRKKAETISKRLFTENLIGNLEAELLNSADSRIDLEIEFFQDLHAKFMQIKPSARFEGKKQNLIDMTEKTTAASNQKAIAKALAYCKEAVKTLESMKLSPELDLEKFQELRAGIPDIGEYSEITGSRTIPGSKIPGLLDQLPADTTVDWKIGKIAEKFKKIITRRK